MRILSWNIQHGGGKRAHKIIEAIEGHAPDVIALNEYRTGPGAALCRSLGDLGWTHVEATTPMGADNGLCVLSKTPLRRRAAPPAPPENAVRWLDVDLPAYGFAIGVLHILCAVPGAMAPSGATK